MTDQLEKIGPLDRIASRQHEHWNLQCRDLVDQMLTLIRARVPWDCGPAGRKRGNERRRGRKPGSLPRWR